MISTASDYCIVAGGYKVCCRSRRGGTAGGSEAAQNAFEADLPVDLRGPRIALNQHNIVRHKDIPDKDTAYANPNGNSSIRGGALAEKVCNPGSQTPL